MADDDIDPDVLYARMARLELFAVFMRPTERYDWSTAEGERLMRRHLRWQLELEEQGRLIAAGPLDHGRPVTEHDPIVNAGGLFVVAAADRAEAEAIAGQEPFFRHGWRTFTVRSWLLNQGVARTVARQAVERFGDVDAVPDPADPRNWRRRADMASDHADRILTPEDIFGDDRGRIIALPTFTTANTMVIESAPGAVRGNHYHHNESHLMYVVSGVMIYLEEDEAGEVLTLEVRPGEAVVSPRSRPHATVFPVPTIITVLSDIDRRGHRYEDEVVRVAPLNDRADLSRFQITVPLIAGPISAPTQPVAP